MDPTTQSVFSLPCIGIQICGYELQCQSAVASPTDGGFFWVDFNLVPQRITTYCILAAQTAQPSYTVAVYTEDDRGTRVERINLSITTSESPSDYARFWESNSSPHHSPKENFVTIEVCLAPSDVVSHVPTKASVIPVTKDSEGASQSQQQQLTGLLTGLRAYAEQMLASSSATSSQSSSKDIQCLSQQQRIPLKFKNIFASCKSPLLVDVVKGSNSQATTSLPTPPPSKPKSFFTDPDISFEESAEGLGLHIPSPKMPTPRPKTQLKHQTVRTPLSVHISAGESSSAGRRSSGAPSSRSVSSPFSVISGLETPTPIGSCKTLEGPNLGTVNLNGSDDDIASVSHNKFSAGERLAEVIEEDETPPPKTKMSLSQPSRAKCKRDSNEPDSTNNKPLSTVSQKIEGASHSEKETPASQISISKAVGRGRRTTAAMVKTTPITIKIGGKSNTPKKQTPQPISSVEKAKKHIWKSPAASLNPTSLTEVFAHKGDVYDLEEISEIEEPKQPSLETFEKFVDENKLEMLPRNQRHRLHMEDSNEVVGLVEEITNVLGKEATRPLTRGRARGRKATKINEKAKFTKNNDNDEVITEVPLSLQSDTQDALLKPATTKEVERVAKTDELPARQTRSGKRFSQPPANVEGEDSSKETKGKSPVSSGKGKRRGRSANRKDKKAEVALINKGEFICILQKKSKKKSLIESQILKRRPSSDNQNEEEASENKILAGSSDIIRSMRLSKGETPMQFQINSSQEDLLADLSPVYAHNGVQALSQSQERQDRVVNQCPSVRSTLTLLESAHSLHPGPENIDASRLISEVPPSQTPKRAVVVPFTLLQERLYDLRATPERARSANVSPDIQRAPFHPPKIPPSIIEEEEESVLKSKEDDNNWKKISENLFETSKEVIPKKSKSKKRPIFGNVSHLQPVDLDDMEVTPIRKTKTNAPIDEEADIFASPIQPAPCSGTRFSTTQASQSGIYDATTTRTTNFSSRGSQSLSRSNVSPLFISPLTRLEAAVNALESIEEKKNSIPFQADFCPSRQLYNPNVSYLLDQSPGVLSQEHQTKTPPPGGLIVPAFGNKYYNITSKLATLAKTTDRDTKANESALLKQPPKATKKTTGGARAKNKGDGRRFFTSTFAERNKREVERHFFDVVGELSYPSTPKTAGSQMKSRKKCTGTSVAKRPVKCQRKPKQQTKKAKSKIKLCVLKAYLEDTREVDSSDVNLNPYSLENDAGGHDESSYKLQSRPAIRKAAKIAKIKIMETSLIQNRETPQPSPLTFAKSPRGDLTTTLSSIERPRRDLNASQTSLFDPTPNNTAIFDFTMSEDDELVSGLPRFGKETATAKEKVRKKSCIEDVEIIDLDDGVQPVLSYGLISEMFRCIRTFYSTLELAESDFKTRINQLKNQVDEMHRLLKSSKRSQAEGQKT
ncbi:hypothetical protein ACTXT7_002512 [Hymenolepis weldensis]